MTPADLFKIPISTASWGLSLPLGQAQLPNLLDNPLWRSVPLRCCRRVLLHACPISRGKTHSEDRSSNDKANHCL
ncbi:hypothetical protein AUEXF2481DRAFT_39156 [Aureobasidium subglaciale EXF-2481]|uniref:Uncharacterized protein n=1 Tax=Aureobasidium subglaciale (strain EXF-2481) TaxID=1043005 RepID=A0A074YE94_AURSE|nr:uncharacterized protein AUEXF2481DRAFT_39156 [Aureobasidium subglaciale EXF-2481]KEQ96070.1 hypothetical protein AUEXF2481DRAFT_39156 [Aureobasidium subglaciale EXF-2481]